MIRWLSLLLLPALAAPAVAKPVERIAVVSAFEPEWQALRAEVAHPQLRTIDGVDFVTGTIAGKPVLLFLSGISMTNAAMTMQLALDRFAVGRIIFSGVAGGVDPSLDVGDVVVPARWGPYLEAVFARAGPDGSFAAPEGERDTDGFANYGMIFPRGTAVRRSGAAPERRFWFEADPAMLAVAAKIAPGVALKRCVAALCLTAVPRVIVGGNGVSGAAFVDNAEFRAWAFRTFQARVLDMETAAVGQVAYANAVPFIAFRSLSDLAGGDPGKNQAHAFFGIASDNSAAVVTAFLKALP